MTHAPASPAVPAQAPARIRCLNTALRYVTNDRAAIHGQPEDSFQSAADLWSAAGLVRKMPDGSTRILDPTDIAIAMSLLKVSRLLHNPGHEDSWIDLAGYAACGMDVAGRATE